MAAPATSASRQNDIKRPFALRAPPSTGIKMLLILALALLPLGVIAVLASMESAKSNRLPQEAEARAAASDGAIDITEAIAPQTLTLRQALENLSAKKIAGPVLRSTCAADLASIQAKYPAGEMAVFTMSGARLCATKGYSRVAASAPLDTIGIEVRVLGQHQVVRTITPSTSGAYFGVTEFPAMVIARHISDRNTRYGTTLRQGNQAIRLSRVQSDNPIDRAIKVSAPVAGGQMSLELQAFVSPLSALEILLIGLPILMWVAGAVIGWLVVERLLLRPLEQMHRAITIFSTEIGPLVLPKLKTPAHEIQQLGEAFLIATTTLRQHEQELAEGLAKQKRLTREVHHRVKNNLQVISSLINLHSRGAKSEAVMDAYSSIQRRVDALAVVHRHHYAELEENLGLPLRALIGEIASNLRASASPPHQIHITLDIASLAASQDVAAPVAFLITEILEILMLCAPGAHIAIGLAAVADEPGKARLTITSTAMVTSDCLSSPSIERFQRIATGLARQLRAPLEQDTGIGRFSIEIPILQNSK